MGEIKETLDLSNLFSKWDLFQRLIFALIFVVSLPAIILFWKLSFSKAIVLSVMISLLVLGKTVFEYRRCEKMHDRLLEAYGERYLMTLKREIDQVGFGALLRRHWLDLEPKG